VSSFLKDTSAHYRLFSARRAKLDVYTSVLAQQRN